MVESLELLVALWPLALGFVTLVIILAKMHSAIEVINEKVKVLFELYKSGIANGSKLQILDKTKLVNYET